MIHKINLKGLHLKDLEEFVCRFGEPPYRARQIFSWIYGKGSLNFEDMTDISKIFRYKLHQEAYISALKLLSIKQSKIDGTRKFLFQLADGSKIESVLMFDDKRRTLCVSTQVGCALDCKFCATGLMGLQRNLNAGEIVDQFLTVQKIIKEKITNVVFMGMGEPLHNYANTIKAAEILTHSLGPNLAKRHLVISTSGLVPKIIRFADEGHKYRLAISLNATTDEIRSRLMPLNKKWPIQVLLEAAQYYAQKSDEPVTFEYVLMEHINDSEADALRLKQLVENIRCKINLIPYNATDGPFRRPSEKRILKFYERLASLKAPVTIRWSKGVDIEAACGQLVVQDTISK